MHCALSVMSVLFRIFNKICCLESLIVQNVLRINIHLMPQICTKRIRRVSASLCVCVCEKVTNCRVSEFDSSQRYPDGQQTSCVFGLSKTTQVWTSSASQFLLHRFTADSAKLKFTYQRCYQDQGVRDQDQDQHGRDQDQHPRLRPRPRPLLSWSRPAHRNSFHSSTFEYCTAVNVIMHKNIEIGLSNNK